MESPRPLRLGEYFFAPLAFMIWTGTQLMICEHLSPLEQAILARGIRETFRGQPWSMNCREWVYFDCFIDTASVRSSFAFADCVHEHLHRGTHDGQERGFVCSQCHDGIMGSYDQTPGMVVFRD